jgi:hypothetical protein
MNKKISKVYFIKAGDYVKIGVTNGYSIQNRLSELQTGNPIKLELLGIMIGGLKIEKSLHKRFSDFKKQGEWFYYSEEIKDFINSAVLTSLEDIDSLEQVEEITAEYYSDNVKKPDEILKLKGNLYALKQSMHGALIGLANTYKACLSFDSMMSGFDLIKSNGDIIFDSKNENPVLNDKKYSYRDVHNGIGQSIYKSFRQSFQYITHLDWRHAQGFLNDIENGEDIEKLIKDNIRVACLYLELPE